MRHELLFATGEPCDPRRLAETERLLRAQSYIRAASVTPRDASAEYVDLDVRTQDDWSLRGSARLEAGGAHGPVRRVRLAEENLWGRGLRGQVRFNNEGREPGFDVDFSTRQFFGHHDAEALLGNSGVGPVLEQSVLRPFASEFDRTAWREATRYRKEPFFFQSRSLGLVAQPMVVTGADLGIARRFGRPGLLAITGGVLSYERVFAEGPAFASLPANDSAAAAALASRFVERRRLRGHVLIGARTLKFVQRSGVDAVNAAEDIRIGFEGGVIGGRSLFGGSGLQHDMFGAAEFYTGAAPGERTLLFVRAKWEGRWIRPQNTWDGVIASADLVAYRMHSLTSTYVFGFSAGGGWHTTTPFQLTLGGPFGVRGYGTAMPVERRVVFHAEKRKFRGVALGAVDVGTSMFLDVGQGWAGDAPFGENTGVKGAIGMGLRLAFPSGSRLTYRLDVAVPVGRGRGLEIRTGFRQQFGALLGEADDLARSREQVSSTTVFNFPRF